MTTQVLTPEDVAELAKGSAFESEATIRRTEARVLAKLQAQQPQAAGVPEEAETVYQITDAFEGDPKHTWRDATAGVYWSHPVSKRRILYRHISPPEAVGVPDRPCHVYSVEKRGSMCEWSPTTMAFALPDGVHALYTLTTPPHPATAQPTTTTADDVRDARRYRFLLAKSHYVHGTVWIGNFSAKKLDVDFLSREEALAFLEDSLDAAMSQQAKEV